MPRKNRKSEIILKDAFIFKSAGNKINESISAVK